MSKLRLVGALAMAGCGSVMDAPDAEVWFDASEGGTADAAAPSDRPDARAGDDASPACTGGWSLEETDLPHDAGGSVATDAGGGLHVAHTFGARLTYARRATDGAWSDELVDLRPVTRSSIGIDPIGVAHIAYVDEEAEAVWYASKPPGGAWTVSRLDDGAEPSLAIDPAGAVHVAYVRAGNLQHAWRPLGGGWSHELVDNDLVYTYQQPSLASDGVGGLHVVYRQRRNTLPNIDLRYAHLPPAGAWEIGSILPDADVLLEATLTADAAGRAHLVYFDTASDRLFYGSRPAAGEWSFEPIGSAAATALSIVADRAGAPHIAARDPATARVRYIHRTAGSWDLTASFPSDDPTPRLAIGPDDELHLLYRNDSAELLHGSLCRP